MLTPLLRKSNAPLCFLGPSFVRSFFFFLASNSVEGGAGAEGPPSPRDPVPSTFDRRKGVVVALSFAIARDGASCRVGRGGCVGEGEREAQAHETKGGHSRQEGVGV